MNQIETIINEIYREGSEYDEIVKNILYPNIELKAELLSEIFITWLEKPEKIIDIYNQGYLKYYFVMAVKNQVKSSTSSFHKNIRKTNNLNIDDVSYDLEWCDGKDDIEVAIDNYNKLQVLKQGLNNLDINFFDRVMFEEYYYQNKSYRKIGKEYKIHYGVVFNSVKKTIDKLKNNINEID